MFYSTDFEDVVGYAVLWLDRCHLANFWNTMFLDEGSLVPLLFVALTRALVLILIVAVSTSIFADSC